MKEVQEFFDGVTTENGMQLTNAQQLKFAEDFNRFLTTSPELAKIFFNTQVYNKIVNDVTTRGGHSEGVAIVAEQLAIKTAELSGKSPIEQKISGLIARALGYMHDLGHTPFGHDGESALGAEMERFEATPEYKDKRQKLFGKKYVTQAGDAEVEVMCYEHNETSAIIGAGLIEKFARENGYQVSAASIQYMKTGILSHSTSRVKEEPNGAEQKAVRLADKVAYIPQDLLDLLKQGVLNIDDLTNEEQALLGLNEQQLTFKEEEEYASLITEEDRKKYVESRQEYKRNLKEQLRNKDRIPEVLKLKLFRKLDSRVAEMQAEIAQECFSVDEKGMLQLDGRKATVDFYDKAVNKGKIPTDRDLTDIEREGMTLFRQFRNAQKMPMTNADEITSRKQMVDEKAKSYMEFLISKEGIDPTMAALWVTKAKYQDAFIKGELSRVSLGSDSQVRTETLGDINQRYDNGWKMKSTFQYFYSNIGQIPKEFLAKYQQGEKSVYTDQQIVSAFIASFTNNGLDELYQSLLQRNLVISRDEAIRQLQQIRPDLDIAKIISSDKKWIDPQNSSAQYKVGANDVLEFLYEENVGRPIVTGKDKIIDREPIPTIPHAIAVRDGIEAMRERDIQKTTGKPELLVSAIDISTTQINADEIKTMVSSIINKQKTNEIDMHIEAVRKSGEEK